MNDRIQEIRERLEAATPGPWMWENDNKLISVNPHPGDEFGYVLEGAIDAENGESFIDVGDPDALFVATAHEDTAYLLSEVERLQEQSKRWEKAFDNADKQYLKKEKELAELKRRFNEFDKNTLDLVNENIREKKRLRKALEEAVHKYETGDMESDFADILDGMYEVCKDALGESDKE